MVTESWLRILERVTKTHNDPAAADFVLVNLAGT